MVPLFDMPFAEAHSLVAAVRGALGIGNACACCLSESSSSSSSPVSGGSESSQSPTHHSSSSKGESSSSSSSPVSGGSESSQSPTHHSSSSKGESSSSSGDWICDRLNAVMKNSGGEIEYAEDLCLSSVVDLGDGIDLTYIPCSGSIGEIERLEIFVRQTEETSAFLYVSGQPAFPFYGTDRRFPMHLSYEGFSTTLDLECASASSSDTKSSSTPEPPPPPDPCGRIAVSTPFSTTWLTKASETSREVVFTGAGDIREVRVGYQLVSRGIVMVSVLSAYSSAPTTTNIPSYSSELPFPCTADVDMGQAGGGVVQASIACVADDASIIDPFS